MENITANRLIIAGKRMHYTAYIKYLAEQLPQFEEKNHKYRLKRVYRLQGMKGIRRYIKTQYIIYRSIIRKESKNSIVSFFWKLFYNLFYSL